jgi:DNA-binding HxlR family transcriptional regulator
MILQQYDASKCLMTKILHLMSGKWKPIILYLVKHDINRFGMMVKKMPGISKKVLTEQLRELETDGLISREVIEARAPQVIVYHLTEKGFSLRKLIDDMLKWGLVYLKEDYDLSHYKEFQENKDKEDSLIWESFFE